jgi:hypothetical protein
VAEWGGLADGQVAALGGAKYRGRERGPVAVSSSQRSPRAKRKGLQLALEPLNGWGIAGYMPEPKLWARAGRSAPREESHVVGALAVIGDVEALALFLD